MTFIMCDRINQELAHAIAQDQEMFQHPLRRSLTSVRQARTRKIAQRHPRTGW